MTAEQVLGIEKSSYLLGLVPQEGEESSSDLKISPVILRPGSKRSIATEENLGKTIDPWMVERDPNPFMFPHLRKEWNEEHGHMTSNRSMPSCTDLKKIPGPFDTDGDKVSENTSFKNSRSTSFRYPSSVDKSNITSTRIAISAPQRVVRNHNGNKAPQGMDRRRNFHINSNLLVLTNLTPNITSFSKANNVSMFEEQNRDISRLIYSFDVGPQSNLFKPMKPNLSITPESDSPAALQEISLELGVTKGSAYPCPQCKLTLRTASQLNTHLNQRHRRRYTCEHCTSAFTLKNDLKRHILTVHHDTYRQEARVWRCSNTGCNFPNKEFRRKDNFVRHMSRCSRE